MKKTLLSMAFAAFSLLSMQAAETVITFNAGETVGANTTAQGADTMTKNGVTISTTAGGFNCVNFNTQAGEYRFGKGSTNTFAVANGAITKVVFTCTVEGDAKYGPGCFTDPSAGAYTFEGFTGTWTGSAASFTLTASSNQVRATKIEVTIDGDVTPTPDPDPDPDPEPDDYTFVGNGTEANPYTAADAIHLAVTKKYTNDKVYIKGIIFKVGTTDENITKYSNIDYYISDNGEEIDPSFEVFRGKYFNDEAFTLENKVLVGDEVVVLGAITYYEKNSQPETTQGAVLVKLVRNGVEIKPEVEPEPQGHGFEVTDPLNVEEAVDMTQELAEGATSSEVYYIKGIISQIDEVSTQFGNATYYISDNGQTAGQLEVFRGKWFDNEKFTAEDQIKVGDQVVLKGKLQNYKDKEGNLTPEITASEIVLLNGEASGINAVSAASVKGQAYNLRGQRVSESYRGLVIIGGKKVMQ